MKINSFVGASFMFLKIPLYEIGKRILYFGNVYLHTTHKLNYEDARCLNKMEFN
jgi:hypothetical protein